MSWEGLVVAQTRLLGEAWRLDVRENNNEKTERNYRTREMNSKNRMMLEIRVDNN